MTTSSPPSADRVLVVDDVEDNRDLYAEYLRSHGFIVDTAHNAEEALRVADASPPQVVVMDLVLPDVDGWEAIRMLRANERTRGVRVLVLTGYSSADIKTRAKADGVDAVCTKPCPPDALLSKIRELAKAAREPNDGSV